MCVCTCVCARGSKKKRGQSGEKGTLFTRENRITWWNWTIEKDAMMFFQLRDYRSQNVNVIKRCHFLKQTCNSTKEKQFIDVVK